MDSTLHPSIFHFLISYLLWIYDPHIQAFLHSLCTSSVLSPMSKDVEPGFSAGDYLDQPPAPFFDADELLRWSFYRAVIAEFVATLLFLYVGVLTVIGNQSQSSAAVCAGVGVLGIAWAFGGTIFVLVYCTAGISGKFCCSLSPFGFVTTLKPLRQRIYF